MNFLLFMPPAEGQEGGGLMSFLPLVLIVLVDQRKYRETIKKGDKIVTIGGIHGKIIEVQEKTFTIEVEGQNRLKIERTAVAMDSSSQIGANK
jgi:preprotein translocase subunit YajC